MSMHRSQALVSPKKLVYFDIAEHGMVSKADLLGRVSMTSSTLTRLLDEMVAEQLILASKLGPSSGGRRPILYEINPDYGYFFGIEISRMHSSLGFFDMRMNPKSFTRWRMDEAMTPNRFVQHVTASMKVILQDHQIDPEQVLGIGVGAVGPLNREKGLIVKPLYFPAQGWADVPICRMLEEATGIPASLENGANTALLGEHWSLRPASPQHMLYVHAGVSLRSAMMSYGEIIHGSIDMEGAVGQMIIQTDGPRLHEGSNFGALEAFVSVQALEKLAQSQAKMGRNELADLFPGLQPEQIRYDLLLQALKQNHPYTVGLFQQSASCFGIGLANMINMLHPEMIILGGALVNADQRFYQIAIDIARKMTYYYPAYQPVFSKGELREDAVATGAALMMWKKLSL